MREKTEEGESRNSWPIPPSPSSIGFYPHTPSRSAIRVWVTPRLPTSSPWVLCAPGSCHRAGREARELPRPRSSPKPALPAEEPRPAGEARRVPSPPPASAPGTAPSPRAKGAGTALPRVLLTRGWEGLSLPGRFRPWGASVRPCHPFTHRARHKTALCPDSPPAAARLRLEIPGHARPGAPVPAAPCRRLRSVVP